MQAFLASALERIFPATPLRAPAPLRLLAARGERVAFQACFRNEAPQALEVTAAVAGAAGEFGPRIRAVGLVCLPHFNPDTPFDELDGMPGLVPDPLLPQANLLAGPFETRSFWIDLRVPRDARPGDCRLEVLLAAGADSARLEVVLTVAGAELPPLADFPVTHWFYADALCDRYGLAPYEEKFWPVCAAYQRDLAEHGTNTLYTPLFTPPLDGVKRPHQLLRVRTPQPGSYEFDWTDVRRWLAVGRAAGFRRFEWSHLATQWGAAHAIRIYRDNADPQSLLWAPDTPACGEVYRGFLGQFLPAFQAFLADEGLLDHSVFHLSDEPHGDLPLANYRQFRGLLRELAPWMPVTDALSDVRFALEKLTDMPAASIGEAATFQAHQVPHWVYFCCGPRGRFLNRLLDTPLAKIRMSGWLFHRLGARGFLHWGFNYWYRSMNQGLLDPWQESAGGNWPLWPYGDPFMVYPGADGQPVDSLRWEVFAHSLQDLALLRSHGMAPGDPLLAEIQGYDTFPKTAAWIDQARTRLLAGR
ncbi:MAG: DUF4091 domain-containing protein [Lentisphaeria bacterium]